MALWDSFLWLSSDCSLLFSRQGVSDSFVNPWTVAHRAPLSVGFSRQEYWSGLPFPLPGDLPDPRFQLESPALAGRFFTTQPPVFIWLHRVLVSLSRDRIHILGIARQIFNHWTTREVHPQVTAKNTEAQLSYLSKDGWLVIEGAGIST